MASPITLTKAADNDALPDVDVEKPLPSGKAALETEAKTDAKAAGGKKDLRGCCCKAASCFFCYIPWIPIILAVVSLLSSIISLVACRTAASLTKDLADFIGIGKDATVNRVFNIVPLAVLIAMVVVIVLVVGIFLLALVRAHQRAMHRGMYGAQRACGEHECCYWSLLVPSYIVSAIWWFLCGLVVVLLMAITVWLVVFVATYYVSGVAISKTTELADDVNVVTHKLVERIETFVETENQTVNNALSRINTPQTRQAQDKWNDIMDKVIAYNISTGECIPGCLDVSMFRELFDSISCICAKDALEPIRSKSLDIWNILIVALAFAIILYVSASLLMVNLVHSNTNSFRDQGELLRLREEREAAKLQETQQLIDSPPAEQALQR